MFIAQKTLKSMPSTTPDMNQDNDDIDDFTFSSKSGAISPASSPSISDRQSSMIPSTDDSYHFDQPTTMTPIVNSSERS
jgi:hypothetical protein